jgi:lipopolysaccharide heptosyltransferase II
VTSDLERRAVEDLSGGGRILVTRLQYLGDVILTLPAVGAIQERFPRARIDYLSRSAGAAVIEGDPRFARVLKVPEKGEGVGAFTRLVSMLRGGRYAAAVDWYSNPRSALLTYLSGARMRIGGDRRYRKRFYTHRVSVPGAVRSAIEHHLYHLKPLGIDAAPTRPVLTIDAGERERGVERLAAHGAGPGTTPVVGIHPGGKWDVKRWPAESFSSLAKRLVDRHGYRVAVLCGPGEEPYRESLRRELGDRAAYLPVMPIRETAAVIASLDGMVVGDGGIMHVSVAVGTPTVGIFGSSEPDIWFPYEPFGPFVPAYEPIECRPCHLHTCGHLSCLRGLAPDTVEAKLIAVMTAAREKTAKR